MDVDIFVALVLTILLFIVKIFCDKQDRDIDNKTIKELSKEITAFKNMRYDCYQKRQLIAKINNELLTKDSPDFNAINQWIITLKGYYDKKRT